MIVINIIEMLREISCLNSADGCAVRMRISLKKSGIEALARVWRKFCPAGECSGCLTYPCKPRQSVFARAGYHAWRQQPYLRGPVAEADPEPLIDMINTPSLLQVPVCR